MYNTILVCRMCIYSVHAHVLCAQSSLTYTFLFFNDLNFLDSRVQLSFSFIPSLQIDLPSVYVMNSELFAKPPPGAGIPPSAIIALSQRPSSDRKTVASPRDKVVIILINPIACVCKTLEGLYVNMYEPTLTVESREYMCV